MGWLIAIGLLLYGAGSFYAGSKYGQYVKAKEQEALSMLRRVKGQL